MATKITNATISDCITGSAEKRVDTAPDGTLWTAIVDPNKVRFFYSTDGGSTWRYATGSDVSLGQYSGAPSFFIDADGFAHMSMQRFNTDPQVLTYWRGKPTTGAKGWSWNSLTINPAGGRMGVDSDVVAFRNGDGWVAFCLYNIPAGHRIARVNITATGALSVGATSMPGITDGYANSYASLNFAHTGDGKTPTAAPHLYLVTGAMTSATLRARRLRYESGNWTAESWVNIATAQAIAQTAMVSIFDGTRLLTFWSPNDATIDMAEWDTTSATVTRRDPAAMQSGSGTIGALSVACDPATGDIYLVAYGYTTDNVFLNKFTRSSTSWGTWTQVATRASNSDGDGNVQLVRYPQRGNVDMVYVEGPNGSYLVEYQQLVTLTVTPNAPTLLRPSSGSQVDLTGGGTFSWDYNEVGPGDTQSAWAFRRVSGSTTQYWNNPAQSWSSTLVWNTGALNSVTFPSGAWPVGTYSWSVAAKSSAGTASAFAANRTVISTTLPVVIATSPSGIVYDTSTPIVQWTYTFGDAQRNYEIRVQKVDANTDPDNAAQNVWGSGVVTSTIARSAQVAVPLSPNIAYRAFVRATSTSGLTSAWDYVEFVLSLAPPTGPTIEATNYVSYETGVPRAQLRLMARSNEMDLTQSQCLSGWEISTGGTVATVQRDTVNQIEAGFSMTSNGTGKALDNPSQTVARARTSTGTPPDAPYGQPALTGPVSFPVQESETYTFLISAKSPSAVRAARLWIRWHNKDDVSVLTDGTTIIGDDYGNQFVLSTTAYSKVWMTVTAPAGAKLGRLFVEVLDSPNGEVTYFTSASFHPGISQDWQPGGYSYTETLRVERSDDGGETWQTLGERFKPNFRQIAVTSDRTMPFGTEVIYRAFTDVDTGIGQILSSAQSVDAHAMVTSDVWALRDKADDTTELNANVTGYESSDEDAAVVLRPSGREYAIVDTEGNQSAEGTLTLYVPFSQRRDMMELLRSGVPILVQSPTGVVFCARFIKRSYNVEDIAAREISVDFVEVS